eukprot:gnl/MRDRNA2_/MRDRNA2_67055_c0_seq2.p1 gnl/MRDRNA2_/MRDRNA2_67055_c0~~gnl/MRDRNA2_/MRDRNA2_67055_c0_seq2.p1  ORF type:complete len:273 (+),score=39.91 gnl/MRDRNA2_/MRDRNA2_67055_c0_seq2:49-867(+)
MKRKDLRVLSFIAITTLGIVGCNPLKKMTKNAELISYEVTPNPLEMHGDSVAISISGKFPEKYFHKKATATATPTLVWEGGKKEFKSVQLVGEAAEGEGTKVPVAGGSFNFTDKIPYQKGMENCEVQMNLVGAFKTKTAELSNKKIGDGTIVTPLLVQSDERPLMGKDKFTKVVPRSIEADIHFLINSSQVRSSELRADDYKALAEFLATGVLKEYDWKGVSISAYASPDGELTKNENLANERAESTAKSLAYTFKKQKIEAAEAEGFFNKN